MSENEIKYKGVISSVGATMLIFLALINLFGFAYAGVSLVLSLLPIPEVAATVIDQLLYAAGYLTSFMVPVAFLKLFLKRKKLRPVPMSLSPCLSPQHWRYLPMIILAAVSISFSAAYINAAMVSIFDYASFSSEFLWGETMEMAPYEIVLNFIVMCLVPGFCEEFLFRGAILSNLRPFGRGNAVLISAFLFALMHQNIEQFFYTFVAGILLGLVYEYTGSIWSCTLLHILNNFVSVIESVITVRLGDSMEGTLLILIFEGLIFLLGTLSAVFLIRKFFSAKPDFSDGAFGRLLPVTDGYAATPVEPSRMRKLFLRPAMVIFIVLAVLQMLLLIGLAVAS